MLLDSRTQEIKGKSLRKAKEKSGEPVGHWSTYGVTDDVGTAWRDFIFFF